MTNQKNEVIAEVREFLDATSNGVGTIRVFCHKSKTMIDDAILVDSTGVYNWAKTRRLLVKLINCLELASEQEIIK